MVCVKSVARKKSHICPIKLRIREISDKRTELRMYSLPYPLSNFAMKIIIDGVRYYTERSESICSRFSERATDFEIEQVQETLYRTDDGKYFSHIWKFEDSATKSYDEEDRLSESVRTMTLEDVITWFRTD